MFDRERNAATPRSPGCTSAGFVLVLWMASSDAMAQVRELVVTEVRGQRRARQRQRAGPHARHREARRPHSPQQRFPHRPVQRGRCPALSRGWPRAKWRSGPKGVTANGKPATAATDARRVSRREGQRRETSCRGPWSCAARPASSCRGPKAWSMRGWRAQFTWTQAARRLALRAVHRCRRARPSRRCPRREARCFPPASRSTRASSTSGESPRRKAERRLRTGPSSRFPNQLPRKPAAEGALPSDHLLYAAWLISRNMGRAATRIASRLSPAS